MKPLAARASGSALWAAEWLELHTQVQPTEQLSSAFAPDHFNYAFLQNHDRHVHLHVIPRYAAPAGSSQASSLTTPITRVTTPSQACDRWLPYLAEQVVIQPILSPHGRDGPVDSRARTRAL
jgi:hypothetical protein